MIVPELVLRELARVLAEKLGLGRESVRRLLLLIEELPARIIDTPASAEARSGDPADDRILAAALAADADVLVSGDRRHLLPLDDVDGLRILSPQQLLAELAA